MRLEILLSSYWEHFKYAKDLALIYPIDNKKRLELEKVLSEMNEEILKFKVKK